MIDWTWYPNFSEWEFTCHCGECHRVDMDPEFLAELQQMRTKLGFPFPITSGFRCPEHNQNVSGSGPDGPHTTGRAVDIAVAFAKAHQLVGEAYERGFTRIGISQSGEPVKRFIHLDRSLTHPSPRIWSY